MKTWTDRAECGQLAGEALERHLFVCEGCRSQARLAAAWRSLAAESPKEAAPVREEFLARVLISRRQAARRDRRIRYLLAAAALLLFTFFAGSGHRTSSGPGRDRQAEEAFASLASPSELEGLLPD